MTIAYVDSSVLVTIGLAQLGHDALAERMAGFDEVYSSNLLEAEVASALHREGVPDDGSLTRRISWVLPDRRLNPEIRSVLVAGYLRGADLWHLACALYVSPDPRELAFLTMDRPQAAVAVALGFPGREARIARAVWTRCWAAIPEGRSPDNGPPPASARGRPNYRHRVDRSARSAVNSSSRASSLATGLRGTGPPLEPRAGVNHPFRTASASLASFAIDARPSAAAPTRPRPAPGR